MFKRWQKYVATGTIQGIDLAAGLEFMADTPLERQIQQHGVYFLKPIKKDSTDYIDNGMWQARKNPDLDIHERLRRRLETHEEAIKYNWPVWRGSQRLKAIKNMANKYLNFLKDQPTQPKIVVKDNLHFFE